MIVRAAGLVVTLALALVGGPATKAAAADLTVLAAASLTEPFRELAAGFERTHPGVKVRLSFAGSQQLAAQLDQGLAADVFAPADERWMEHAIAHATVVKPATPFATNTLVAIVPRSNPGRIARPADLARPGLRIVLAAEAVPAGAYTRRALANLSADSALGAGFARAVLGNVVSQEENVKHVLGKVQLGEADAGFVYRSDVTAKARRHVRLLELPDGGGVRARYAAAVVASTRNAERARAFVAFLVAPEGAAILRRHGFGASPAP